MRRQEVHFNTSGSYDVLGEVAIRISNRSKLVHPSCRDVERSATDVPAVTGLSFWFQGTRRVPQLSIRTDCLVVQRDPNCFNGLVWLFIRYFTPLSLRHVLYNRNVRFEGVDKSIRMFEHGGKV